MRKIASFLILLVAVVSCESDVKFNNPSFQGQKDNFFWRADATTVTVADGNMTIHASRGLEKIDLVFPAPAAPIVKTNPVIYTLGQNDEIIAKYQHDEEGLSLVYKTGKELGNGEIVISEFDPAAMTVSGSFRFNAIYQGDITSVPENLNFQDGFIYKIKIQ